MHRLLGSYVFLLFCVLTGLSVNAQTEAPLRLIHTTLLPGFVGDFEHFAADVKGNRLFMVAEDHKTVEVLTQAAWGVDPTPLGCDPRALG